MRRRVKAWLLVSATGSIAETFFALRYANIQQRVYDRDDPQGRWRVVEVNGVYDDGRPAKRRRKR